MEFKQVATMMSRVKKSDYWFAFDYNVNLYRGCSHGCIYCDSRSKSYRIDDFETVTGKRDSLLILEQEMKKKRKHYIIGTGAMSDPYNPQEKKYELTRGLIKLCIKYQVGLCLTTKSALIIRDLDLLVELNKTQPVLINVTITTENEDISKRIERHVASPKERLAVLKQLREHDIMTTAIIMPILPFINDKVSQLKKLLTAIQATGTNNIYAYFGVTLRDRQRSYFYRQLERQFGLGMVNLYKKTFYNKYNCQSPEDRQLRLLLSDFGASEMICTNIAGINKRLLEQKKKQQSHEQTLLF